MAAKVTAMGNLATVMAATVTAMGKTNLATAMAAKVTVMGKTNLATVMAATVMVMGKRNLATATAAKVTVTPMEKTNLAALGKGPLPLQAPPWRPPLARSMLLVRCSCP